MKTNIREFQTGGDSVYLKKSKLFGWRVVYPVKTNKKINWKNLIIGGSWIRFILLVIIILAIIGAISEYNQAIRIANVCINNPNLFLPNG